jgi:hypothetical protein
MEVSDSARPPLASRVARHSSKDRQVARAGWVSYPQSSVVITIVAVNFRGKEASIHESPTRWTPRRTGECRATHILRIRVGSSRAKGARRRPASRTRDQSSFRVFPTVNVGETTARFRKVNEDNLNGHRDALEFSSGEIVLLKRLCEANTRSCCNYRPLRMSPPPTHICRRWIFLRADPCWPTSRQSSGHSTSVFGEIDR